MKFSFSAASLSTMLSNSSSRTSRLKGMGVSLHAPNRPERFRRLSARLRQPGTFHPRRRPGHPKPLPEVVGLSRRVCMGETGTWVFRGSCNGTGRSLGWVAAIWGHSARSDSPCDHISIFHSDGEFPDFKELTLRPLPIGGGRFTFCQVARTGLPRGVPAGGTGSGSRASLGVRDAAPTSGLVSRSPARWRSVWSAWRTP